MAWFSYKCAKCGREFKQSLSKREQFVKCLAECNGQAENVVKTGTSSVHERLDNGAMARSIERLHNVEELMEERAAQTNEQENDEDSGS